MFVPNARCLRLLPPRLRRTSKPTRIPGTSSHRAAVDRRLGAKCISAAPAAEVEMLMTTFAAELPGVTGVEGLNRHCASAGSPEHDSVTAELNDDPTG